MGSEFTFYDYLENDTNVIREWLDGPGRAGKANLNSTIMHLEAAPPGSGVWSLPYLRRLKFDWKGFSEIRKDGPVQYRLIFLTEGRLAYIVACGIHKDQHFQTTVTPTTARERVARMKSDPRRHRCRHDPK